MDRMLGDLGLQKPDCSLSENGHPRDANLLLSVVRRHAFKDGYCFTSDVEPNVEMRNYYLSDDNLIIVTVVVPCEDSRYEKYLVHSESELAVLFTVSLNDVETPGEKHVN